MYSTSNTSVYSYLCPGSPASSVSGGCSHVSSWGTMLTPVPGTPFSAPIPLPVCCSPGHPSPASYTPAVAHPALQQLYNAIVPPRPAPYSSEPATLRLTPHPNTRIPFMDVTLSSLHPGPLTVHDVHVFIYRTLSRAITHSDLQALTEQVAHDAASSAFYAQTANNPNAFATGMCVGDRMGGAWCVVGIMSTGEPGVWEVRLDVPRRR